MGDTYYDYDILAELIREHSRKRLAEKMRETEGMDRDELVELE
ncbi:MAG: hypothetical protein MAG715_00992 [Methanonatronarchaeales archaeon]|nr:hypothetical protein [Methanonatronarchaeales archaeon]